MSRTATINRTTKETTIALSIDLDGDGSVDAGDLETLQSLLDSGVVDKLHDMGVSQVVAQVMPTTVVPLGAHIEGTNMVFDLDILSKKY